MEQIHGYTSTIRNKCSKSRAVTEYSNTIRTHENLGLRNSKITLPPVDMFLLAWFVSIEWNIEQKSIGGETRNFALLEWICVSPSLVCLGSSAGSSVEEQEGSY
ncbi:hypothetical protein V6N11_060978 [Hibiscus sabdariffa]|uniref:Uncharacterized protein n=2 Tax=Hibiscus sabdariffa TaxID=183260 RepID=A0ABR2QS75_9ROSI